MKKTKLFLTIAFCGLVAVSCSKQSIGLSDEENFSANRTPMLENTERAKNGSFIAGVNYLESSTQISNANLLSNLQNRVSTNWGLQEVSDMLDGIEITTAIVSSYSNSDKQCITIPLGNDYTLMTYSKNEIVWDNAMIIRIVNNNGTTIVSYYDLNLNPIVSIDIVNGIFGSAIVDPQALTLSAWGSWGNCVTSTVNMIAGNPVGAIGCLYFGPECGGAIALSCAVSVALGWW